MAGLSPSERNPAAQEHAALIHTLHTHTHLPQAYMSLARNCRTGGTPLRLADALRSTLLKFLPKDAHERCSGTCHIAVTRLLPFVRTELVSHFDSRVGHVSLPISWTYRIWLVSHFDSGVYCAHPAGVRL